MKVAQLKELSAREWSKMSSSELRKSYQSIKHALAERNKTFRKHGLEGRTLPSSRGLSDTEIRQLAQTATAYMRGRRSTYAGRQASAEDQLHKMQKAMPDMGFETVDDVRKFGKFMDEMDDRFGEAGYPSSQAKKLYKEAQRLNVDPKKFMRNYDYWIDHIKDLEKATPIRQRAGSRALKPSDYARQISKMRAYREGSD